MERSLGDGYISTVRNMQGGQGYPGDSDARSEEIITIAGDVTMDRLGATLLALNGLMIVIIPLASWVLATRTLRPIEKAYDRQRQFVSDASHELRTPLTVMRGELDVALQRARTPAQYREALTSSREEMVRLQELTDSLLYIARSDQHRLSPVAENVDLVDLITEVMHQLRPLAKKKQVKITFNPPSANPKAVGSSVALRQLFTNLLENAVKFTPKGDKVMIGLTTHSNSIQVAVQDDGIGMTKQAVERAFERFYRADTSRTDKGFGLGLAISKAIVEQHHGTITLRSEVDKGTTVTISLPKH